MGDETQQPLFEFVVSEPEKKERSGKLDLGYWTYRIYTKTTLETFRHKELVSERRYNDFVWIREQLVETYPGCIVPPIPEKSIKGALEKVVMLNANPLLEYRQRALRKFLVRVGAHPILCTSDVLRDFLELNAEEFQKRKQSAPKPGGGGVSFGQKFSEMSFSLWGKKKAAAKDEKTKEKTTQPPKQTVVETLTVEEQDAALTQSDAWEDTKVYVDKLEKCLQQLKDRIELLVKRRRETSVALSEFGKSFVKVGEIESSYEEGPLPKALVDVGRHSEHLSIVYQEQADNETIQVIETIIYYMGLTNAVREVVARLKKITLTRDTANHSLQQIKDKRENAAAKGGMDDQLRKLDVEISNAKGKADDASQQVSVVENTFREELRRFHREKQYDIKQMLKAFVDLQLEYSGKMKNSWESVLPSVDAIKSE